MHEPTVPTALSDEFLCANIVKQQLSKLKTVLDNSTGTKQAPVLLPVTERGRTPYPQHDAVSAGGYGKHGCQCVVE